MSLFSKRARRVRGREQTVKPRIELFEKRVLLATFTVTNNTDSGLGSLRQAILDSNVASGATNTIDFNIQGTGVQVILPLSPLPTISVPVVLDGYTQPGSSPNTLARGDNAVLLIELDGTAAGAGADGLFITAGGSTVEGLVINQFVKIPDATSPTGFSGGHGILLQTNGGSTIQGNFLGTNAQGTTILANQQDGVRIDLDSGGNSIGGTTPAARNVISGNGLDGIDIGDETGAVSTSTNNLIQGNLIGTDATGTTNLGNSREGVHILSSSGNTVGGTAAGAGNVISGNASFGIGLQDSGTSATIMQGNMIGTDVTGTVALGNGGDGIVISNTINTTNPSSLGNTIGGTTAAARNIIAANMAYGIEIFAPDGGGSGNLIQGNYVGTNATGTVAMGNAFNGIQLGTGATNNTIGGTAGGASNVISGNAENGVEISGSGTSGNVLEGNYIGTNVTGTIALGNGSSGVSVDTAATNNTIGGTTGVARNVISGNAGDGIDIFGTGTSNNLVEGNDIGVSAAGNGALPNGTPTANTVGIVVYIFGGASANIIGGRTNSARNVISGNLVHGIIISDLGTSGNLIEGNYIGTDVSGTIAIQNGSASIQPSGDGVGIIRGATDNTIGGTAQGQGNLISGNLVFGVAIADAGTSGNLVEGNLIGVDHADNAPLPNQVAGVELGNSSEQPGGSAPGNTIGGSVTGAANVISGNGGDGIDIATGSSELIEGNFIGTDATGSFALGNRNDGISINTAAINNTIGGTSGGALNVISGNAQNGVEISGIGTSGNVVEGNKIGTDVTGTLALANGLNGVFIDTAATNNTIGGTAGGALNVIGGNGEDGVEISGAGTNGNVVEGNNIGTDATGTAALGNLGTGVSINGASANTIGGTTPGSGNVISGNRFDGIDIGAPFSLFSDGNLVQGNKIGTNTAGTAALGNGNPVVNASGGAGVRFFAGTFNTVENNVISGNVHEGIFFHGDLSASHEMVLGNLVGTNFDGTAAIPNGLDGISLVESVGNTISGNVISGNGNPSSTSNGIKLTSADGNLIQANLIGTDASGTRALPNISDGVFVSGSNNTIGGTTDNDRNVISGNGNDGVEMTSGASNNAVWGNYIGVGADGTTSLGNVLDGVSIASGATSNKIGGTTIGALNIISGNSGDGIDITGPGTMANLIQGNYIGTDATGTAALGNLGTGVSINGASANTIGGTAPGSGNVISGNSADGIELTGSGSTANVIEGNLIGTNASGTNLGNTSYGVLIDNFASYNTINGANTVGFNAIGIDISGAGVTGNAVLGNFIGTNARGAKLGNNVAGLLVNSNANHTTIGPANTIGFNGTGIDFSSGATANVVLGNFIGTNAAGANLGNVGPGVLISAAPNNTIGGTASGLENVIAANGGSGITIVGASENGVYFDSTGNILIGNLIGTDGTGSRALGNLGAGVSIQTATNNTVGPGNVISGNGMAGVELLGSVIAGVFRGATSNTINSNKIGTNSHGTAAVPNGLDGILLTDAATNSISGNVISGNGASGQEAAGIDILNVNSTGNVVSGNLIGTDATGTFAVGNSLHGVFVGNGASRNVIGPGNVISGSGGPSVQGVGVYLDGTATQSNSVIGNFIGINKAGNAAIGGSSVGVLISNAHNNTVGGLNDGDRNIISGNSVVGVYIALAGATGNVVQNNCIGTDVSGLVGIPNGVDGIYINGAPGNLIGGTGQGTGNLISANQSAGIQIYGAGASGNQFFRNRIGLDANGRQSLPNRITGIFSQISIQANNFGFNTANQNLGQVSPWQSPVSIRDGLIIMARTEARLKAQSQLARVSRLARAHHAVPARKLPIAAPAHSHPHARTALQLSLRDPGSRHSK
jgi:hypothetical protein